MSNWRESALRVLASMAIVDSIVQATKTPHEVWITTNDKPLQMPNADGAEVAARLIGSSSVPTEYNNYSGSVWVVSTTDMVAMGSSYGWSLFAFRALVFVTFDKNANTYSLRKDKATMFQKGVTQVGYVQYNVAATPANKFNDAVVAILNDAAKQ